MKQKRRNYSGILIIAIGLALIFTALFQTLNYIYMEKEAGELSKKTVSQVEKIVSKKFREQKEVLEDSVPDYILDPDMEMPSVKIDREEYIGKLYVPALGLSLPIIANWSYPSLEKAPCRYTGSVYKDNMVIAGHNYYGHFGKFKGLEKGESVEFEDMVGNTFSYQIDSMEVLKPTAIEEMEMGDWDLTLFTCTYGGKMRLAIRCNRVSPPKLGEDD